MLRCDIPQRNLQNWNRETLLLRAESVCDIAAKGNGETSSSLRFGETLKWGKSVPRESAKQICTASTF